MVGFHAPGVRGCQGRQISKGATALLADGIDFGKFQAEDQMEAYKEAAKAAMKEK